MRESKLLREKRNLVEPPGNLHTNLHSLLGTKAVSADLLVS